MQQHVGVVGMQRPLRLMLDLLQRQQRQQRSQTQQ
jgi:hypothetical protein